MVEVKKKIKMTPLVKKLWHRLSLVENEIDIYLQELSDLKDLNFTYRKAWVEGNIRVLKNEQRWLIDWIGEEK